MLERIRIRDLGVIDDVTVDLAPGLNVLTGETGAGKTMVVTGLGLLLGGRGDAGVVRTGADATWVEGNVEVGAAHPVRERVADAGGDATDEVILARSVSAAGRSRAYVGGRAAPVGVLAEVGQMLVAVHGQADQWRLKRSDEHREVLDAYGGPELAEALAEYQRWHTKLGELAAELTRVRQLDRDRHLETQVLLAGLEEIEQVAPEPGEDLALREEDERLGHVEELRLAAAAAYEALSGGDGYGGAEAPSVTTLITEARYRLEQVATHDPALAELAPRVAEIGYLAAELGSDLAGYLAGLDADPGRLEWVQQRRAELGRLTRAYGDTVDEVLAWGERAAARLAELDGAQARLDEIEAETDEARAQAGVAAEKLHAHRVRAAAELGAAVTEELAHLAMGRAVVDVAVTVTPDPDGLVLPEPEPNEPVAFGAHGVDAVEIRLAANPGAPARSVAKAASGGELSRVMLALEVVIGRPRDAGAEAQVSTFVFDEVDAGVGGRAAVDVGARLAALAEHAQVIVVTHLAQVAAFADRHLVVRKTDDGAVTSSDVVPVTGDEQLAELARMMAGSDSATAREHAAELLGEATALKPRG